MGTSCSLKGCIPLPNLGVPYFLPAMPYDVRIQCHLCHLWSSLYYSLYKCCGTVPVLGSDAGGFCGCPCPPPSLFLPLVSDGAKLFSSNEFPRLYCWSKCVGLRPLRGREKVGGDAPQDMMHSIGLYTAAHSKCVPLATARSFFSFLYLSLFFLFLYFQICMDPTYVYNVMQASDGCLWTSRNSLTDFPIV